MLLISRSTLAGLGPAAAGYQQGAPPPQQAPPMYGNNPYAVLQRPAAGGRGRGRRDPRQR